VAGASIVPVINGLNAINSGISTTYAGTPIISGATYQWKLTNGAVSDQLVGSTSNLTITFTEPGSNTLSLTITSGTCTGTTTLVVNVTANCVQTVILVPPATTCSNITAIVSVGTSGSTILSHRWLDAGTTVLQSGGTTIQPLDTSVLINGTTYDVTLEVTFSNGCVITSDVEEYTRPTADLIATTNDGALVGFSDLLSSIPTTDFIRVHQVVAYTCANNFSGTTIFSTPEFDNTQGYIIYEDTPVCPISGLDGTDLETIVNNWLVANDHNAVIDWDTTTANEFTYTASGTIDQRERLAFSYKLHRDGDACSTFASTGVKSVSLDLPCQCP